MPTKQMQIKLCKCLKVLEAETANPGFVFRTMQQLQVVLEVAYLTKERLGALWAHIGPSLNVHRYVSAERLHWTRVDSVSTDEAIL